MRAVKSMLVLLSLSIVGGSCTSTQKHTSSRPLAEQPGQNWDFCQLSGKRKSDARKHPDLWSAETVQQELEILRLKPQMGQSPWAAYTVSYKSMTAARDKNRCDGRLVSEDEFQNNMNHLLSDIMTRWYVTITESCLSDPSGGAQIPGFCPLMQRIKTENLDSLSAAMGTTAVYLSSHLALSLAAMVHVDDFWASSPDERTHTGDRASQIKARVEQLKSFKPTFDRFNSFLADNLITVAKSLKEANMIKGDALNFVSGLARLVPFRASMFGKIRDDAFAAALDIAARVDAGKHPMVLKGSNPSRLDYGTFHATRLDSPELAKIEKFALQAVAGPASMKIYRHLLGGKTWDELEADPELKKDIEAP